MVEGRSVRVALFVVALVAQADAQPSGAQAEVLFRQGRQLMAQKKYAEACAAFDASQKLEPSISTVMNEADCREKNGQLATAWGLFLDAERQTRDSGNASSVQLHKVASQHAAKLEPKLSKLTGVVEGDAKLDGLEITRNGEAADPGAWNRSLPVDGGTYTLVAKAAGHDDWTTSITVGGSADTKSVTIPKLSETPKLAPQHEPAVAATKPTDALAVTKTAPPPPHRSRTVPIVLGIGAVGLLGGGVGLELSSRSTYDQAKVEPNDAKQNSLWKSANQKRYLAEGFAAGGIACAGIAVWLLLRSGGDEPTTTARGVSVEPMFATGGGGLVLDAHY
jgi:hypothetical protein